MPDATDVPVIEPADDLMAMNGHADALAERIVRDDLPLTLGIFGAWGEGKTTFAHLVTHHLRQREPWTNLRFVPFSAWPYVTADAIWRALLEAVARAVYEVKEDPDAHRFSPGPVRVRLREWLMTPVSAESGKSANERACDAFLTGLGRAPTIAARSARTSESSRQLATLSGLLLDVAVVAAPSLATLRGLFGKGEEAAKAAAVRNLEVKGVEEMRHAVRELFRAAGERRTVVIVDDLDRCLPEVAFDVLETLKIVLAECATAETKMLFIVPVDRKILERGLTARLGSDGGPPGANARRYLEKIVQRGISISEVRDSKPAQLIAGHFPEWVGAADLLTLATQGNPRRLKQQCDLLSLHFQHRRAPS